jgi:hypothetical protein
MLQVAGQGPIVLWVFSMEALFWAMVMMTTAAVAVGVGVTKMQTQRPLRRCVLMLLCVCLLLCVNVYDHVHAFVSVCVFMHA